MFKTLKDLFDGFVPPHVGATAQADGHLSAHERHVLWRVAPDGQRKFPQARRRGYECSGVISRRLAASLSL
jgi:hypothetical protein